MAGHVNFLKEKSAWLAMLIFPNKNQQGMPYQSFEKKSAWFAMLIFPNKKQHGLPC